MHGIRGWNDDVKDMHAAARDAYLIWKPSGNARQRVLYDLMRRSRSRFKMNMLYDYVNVIEILLLFI